MGAPKPLTPTEYEALCKGVGHNEARRDIANYIEELADDLSGSDRMLLMWVARKVRFRKINV